MPTFHNETAIEETDMERSRRSRAPPWSPASAWERRTLPVRCSLLIPLSTKGTSFGRKAFRHLLRVTAPNAYVPLKDSPEHTASRINLTLTPTERMLSGKASRARAAMSPRLPVLRQCHSSGAVWTTCLQEHTPDIRETESSWSLRSRLLPRRRGRQGGPERNVTVSAVCCSGL